MSFDLGSAVQIISIVGFIAVLIKMLIVDPLQTAINSLNAATKELKNMLDRLEQDQRCIDKRLVAVEESAKSAHRRLDGVEGH